VVSRALKRRPRWGFENGDRDGEVEMEVRKSLSNLVGSWDVDVTERYLSLGLWKDPDPLRKERGLALKCLPNLEANAYTSVRHTHGFLSLRYLPSTLPILVIFPAKSDSAVYLAASLPGFVRDLPQQRSEVKWFDGYGHMIPFQDPVLVGGEIGEFIRRSLGDDRRARSKL
jgi:pimeloyl-ACP methyl ester carboxylesterase